jgi:multidrug efflux system membrane fusion protein
VTVTQQNETEAVIATGLTPADRVVTTGFANLADGAKVSIGSNDQIITPDLAPRKRQVNGDGKNGERKNGDGKNGERRVKKGGDGAVSDGDQKGQTSPAPAAPAATNAPVTKSSP